MRGGHVVGLVLAAGLVVALACTSEQSAPVNGPDAPIASAAPEYLEEDIPPCTPVEGSQREPCGPDIPVVDTGSASLAARDDPVTIRMMLGEWHEFMRYGELVPAETALHSGKFSGYIVVRATYLPGTVRCEVNRTVRRLGDTTEVVLPEGFVNAVQCFVDVRVNSYILGTGPPQMSVIAGAPRVSIDNQTPAQQEAWEILLEQELDGEGDEGIVGREAVLFLGPANDYSVEAWEVFQTWGVNQLNDGTVMVIHPRRWRWPEPQHRSQVEMTLADFTAAVAAAHASKTARFGGRAGTDPNSPMVVLDANLLHQHHIDTGNTANTAGPPSLPPPARCANIQNNRDLATDCGFLLALKDELRGTGALNWSVDTAIGSWDGVTLGGTPQRVTKLELANKSLTGGVPAALATLELTTLKLAGNGLTGCVPPSLREVAVNDLDDLGLPDCAG